MTDLPSIPSPQQFIRVRCGDGFISISLEDGRVTWPETMTVDEASREFWSCLQRVWPHMFPKPVFEPYRLFGWPAYYPDGGLHDLRGAYDSLQAAQAVIDTRKPGQYDWWHIVHEGKIVASSDPDDLVTHSEPWHVNTRDW